MLIAIDYGKTFDRDPLLWTIFIELAHEKGHRVICVSMRDVLSNMPCPVYCTNGEPKAHFMANLGIRPDVWIDDQPASIVGLT